MADLTWPTPESVVLKRVTGWARGAGDVRACVLTSSRAVRDAHLDVFSDYDIVLVVAPDAVTFTSDDSWIADAYGEPMVTFRSEHGSDQLRPVMRLVLYMDRTKIDFAVVAVEPMKEVATAGTLPPAWDIGYRVLVDKDRLLDTLGEPTNRVHIPMPPTEAAYAAVVEEFWWESTYVAKNLWRGDLVQAKYNLDKVMIIDVLRTMLEWRVEIDHNWTLRPGVLGRYFRERLDAETHGRLETCFADGNTENNWTALVHTCDLFRDVSRDVGSRLGFLYPETLDRNVTDHLAWVRHREARVPS